MKKPKELSSNQLTGHAVVCYSSGDWEEVMIDFNFRYGRFIDHLPKTGYSHSMHIEWENCTEVCAYPVYEYETAVLALKLKLPIYLLDSKSNEIRKYANEDIISKTVYGKDYIVLVHTLEDYLKLFTQNAIPYKAAVFMRNTEVILHKGKSTVPCRLIKWEDYGYSHKFIIESKDKTEELSCVDYGTDYWFTSK